MDLRNFFIPPCLRNPTEVTDLRLCLTGDDWRTPEIEGALPYWTQLLFLLTAIISFLYLLKGAYTMMTALGNEAKYTQGKQTVIYALIGLAISSLASIIVSAFISFFRSPL